tara:strand:+ start:961 stop:2628 length:1668 start_codon:yes stop_codon:yes gene_type:complete
MAKQQTRGNIGTYRRPGVARAAFDPAGTILEGIESAEKDITSRIKTVRDFENAAATRRQDTLDALADTEGMKDFTALDSLQQDLIKEIDELYKLDIASFEGDRSAYLKKQNEMQRVIGDIPALMGLIDQEAELLKENELGGQFGKKFLQSNNKDYYDFVSNASKGGNDISFRIQNGNIIAQLNGKDVFNGHAYINAKKDGYDLVEYAGDYTKEINDADTKAYNGLGNLVTTEITEKIQNGTELTEEQKKDYTLAKQKYRERLESGQIPLPVNESTYQMFTNYATDVDTDGAKMDKWGKDIEIQSAATREAIIDYMVGNRFPEDVVTTKITTKVEKPMNEYQRKSLALQREKLQLAKDKKQKLKTRLSFIETKKAIEDFDTRKLRSGKTTKELVEEFYDRSLEKAEGDKEIVDAVLENSDAWKRLTDPMTSTLDPYLNKKVKIGDEDYKITDFTIGVDDDGDFVIIPTYLDMEGKPPERTQSIQYKFNETGIEALNDDLQLAGSDQFTQPDPITLPSNAEYQTSLTNAKSGDIITKPDGTKVEVLKQNGKTYIKNI